MIFDQDNKIVKLCAEVMLLEGEGKIDAAFICFEQAWDKATEDFEKCIAAHYLARHQSSVKEKLIWDLKALNFALKINGRQIKEMYPSLYLNIGKCYEDLLQFSRAMKNYEAALAYTKYLSGDGYGQMIRRGNQSGIERVSDYE